MEGKQKGRIRKRRRRAGPTLNVGEQQAAEYHAAVRERLLAAHEAVRPHVDATLAPSRQDSGGPASSGAHCVDWVAFGMLARMAGATERTTDTAAETAGNTCAPSSRPLDVAEADEANIYGRLVSNNSGATRILLQLGRRYVVPAYATFLQSDLADIAPLCTTGRYDAIVIDPPWPNRSVARSRAYASLDPRSLCRMPIAPLCAPGALVAIWLTCRQRLLRYARTTLFQHWRLEPCAEWHWLKLAANGATVFALDSTHRKPYEILLIGRAPDAVAVAVPGVLPSPPSPPPRRVVCSVVTRQHSRKPSLADVLAPYLPNRARCLELFARSLTHGWTSWGNEVLRFQDAAEHFVQTS